MRSGRTNAPGARTGPTTEESFADCRLSRRHRRPCSKRPCPVCPGSSRHFATGFGATSAGGDAVFHLADAFAVVRTRFADFGTHPADVHVTRRAALHEIRRRPADLGAIGHQLKVIGLHVLAPKPQAMLVNHVLANAMAFGARLDAVAQIVAVNIGMRMFGVHGNFPNYRVSGVSISEARRIVPWERFGRRTFLPRGGHSLRIAVSHLPRCRRNSVQPRMDTNTHELEPGNWPGKVALLGPLPFPETRVHSWPFVVPSARDSWAP